MKITKVSFDNNPLTYYQKSTTIQTPKYLCKGEKKYSTHLKGEV